MLSKFRLQNHFQSLKTYLRYLNSNNHFRAVENENHDASNEQFKYKTTQTSENVFSQRANVERSTTFVEKIQVLSSPTEFVNNHKTMSDVSRDRLGQWPVESESELSGQGLQRLKNGRFNKVSEWKKREKIDRKPTDDCDVDYYETNNFLGFANSSKNKLLPIDGWCCKSLAKRKIIKMISGALENSAVRLSHESYDTRESERDGKNNFHDHARCGRFWRFLQQIASPGLELETENRSRQNQNKPRLSNSMTVRK